MLRNYAKVVVKPALIVPPQPCINVCLIIVRSLKRNGKNILRKEMMNCVRPENLELNVR